MFSFIIKNSLNIYLEYNEYEFVCLHNTRIVIKKASNSQSINKLKKGKQI